MMGNMQCDLSFISPLPFPTWETPQEGTTAFGRSKATGKAPCMATVACEARCNEIRAGWRNGWKQQWTMWVDEKLSTWFRGVVRPAKSEYSCCLGPRLEWERETQLINISSKPFLYARHRESGRIQQMNKWLTEPKKNQLSENTSVWQSEQLMNEWTGGSTHEWMDTKKNEVEKSKWSEALWPRLRQLNFRSIQTWWIAWQLYKDGLSFVKLRENVMTNHSSLYLPNYVLTYA